MKSNAKNIIIFIGDGMGISTVTAARIYKGQQGGKSGEEATLTFEEFPHTGLSKVRLQFTWHTDFDERDFYFNCRRTMLISRHQTRQGLY